MGFYFVRYIGMKIEGRWDAAPRRDAKGNILKRRDTCAFVRDLYSAVTDTLIEHGPNSTATTVHLIERVLHNLYAGAVSLEHIGLTKTIRDKYKNSSVPQARVAELMRSRGETVRSNDRITYVVLESTAATKSQAKKIGDRVDDIRYVAQHPELKIDYDYYVEHQLYQPLEQLMMFVIPKAQFRQIIDSQKRVIGQRKENAAKRSFIEMMQRKIEGGSGTKKHRHV
jgi:DNA polymerase elongation subunit (family B)